MGEVTDSLIVEVWLMSCPFPGMDPYLEDQGRWTDLHGRLITYACDAISPLLPESYVAQIGEDTRIVTWETGYDRPMRPDVPSVGNVERVAPRHDPAGSLATLEPVTIPLAIAVEEARDSWIEIRRLPDERLVTSIEILSPTTKGSSGLGDYLHKRERILGQPVNLVEIDLLLGGRRLPMARPLPPGDFFVIVSRAAQRTLGDVFAWSIRRPLPSVPIPLEVPDGDIILDLAALFSQAYERGRYSRLIDYRKPLGLPLAAEDRTWAEETARGTTTPGRS